MKAVLITYNIIFLFVGNILFSNIHYFYHHDHDHNHDHDLESVECYECINIELNNNYTLDCDYIQISNNNFEEFEFQEFIKLELNIFELFSSRAPPTSL